MTENKIVNGYVSASTIEEVTQESNQRQREYIEIFCKERNYDFKIYKDKNKSSWYAFITKSILIRQIMIMRRRIQP